MDPTLQNRPGRFNPTAYPEVTLPRELSYREIVLSRAIRKAELRRRRRLRIGMILMGSFLLSATYFIVTL